MTQALFAATLKAEALTLADDSLSDATAQVTDEVRRLNRGALAQMRTLLLELRGDPLEEVPIRQLLRHLIEAAEGRVQRRHSGSQSPTTIRRRPSCISRSTASPRKP